MNTKLHLRVLYRQFLFRLMDVEMLSGSARGDASSLLGQLGALLIFGSLMLSVGAITLGYSVRREGAVSAVWFTERFVLSLTMLIVGIFALLSWDSTFPDRRDVLVLAPLPVRARTLFTAKIAAVATGLGLVVAVWNSAAGFLWPIVLAPLSAGLAETARCVAAFWVTLLAGGAFMYCAVLGVQAAAAQLPRKWYLRVSSVLQIAMFVLFLTAFCLQPSIPDAAALASPENQRALAWLPTNWFLGLFRELSGTFHAEGHAVMAPLARRAGAGLAIAIFAAGAAFVLSYLRTLRKIVEEPDVAPNSRGGIRLPRFGAPPETALAHFAIRTLLRSRPHRVILAFYLGAGFALMAVYLGGARAAMRLSVSDILHRVNAPMLVSSVLMLSAAWLGTRTTFSLPLDLRANWLFRIVPTPGGMTCLRAARQALLTISVMPVVAVSAAVLLWFWPWTTALEHLLVLALAGSVLADLSLRGFRKIPFTCSFLPGKSKVHMVFWFGIVPAIMAIHKLVEWEVNAMAAPLSYWAMAAALAAAAFAARMAAGSSAARGEPEIQFEETASDELVVLGLDA